VIAGGLYGLLIGDAFGVPYEFHDPSNLPPEDTLGPVPPAGFNRSHRGVPVGTWSDDGAQALALLDSLLTCGGLDLDDLGRRFVGWWNHGAYTPDGKPFDIGNLTSDALLRLEAGHDAATAGGTGERDNGNGSLMRVLPVALWCTGPDDELVDIAERQSLVTHGHPRSQAACALYTLWARAILQQHPQPWDDAVATLTSLYDARTDRRYARELATVLAPFAARGSGYVVDCLHSARIALQKPDYPSVIRRAVAFGLDTDTTAAVAGGIAGLRHGLKGIPTDWVALLHGRDQIEELLHRLEVHRGSVP
jgi:ADP-ribosylglycohydrolase